MSVPSMLLPVPIFHGYLSFCFLSIQKERMWKSNSMVLHILRIIIVLQFGKVFLYENSEVYVVWGIGKPLKMIYPWMAKGLWKQNNKPG